MPREADCQPPNNPQVGMANMRLIMPALAKATASPLKGEGLRYASVEVPSQRRETRIVKNVPIDDIARELADWIKG